MNINKINIEKTISFEDLEKFLVNWENINGQGGYDSGGMLLLLKACIQNLKNNCFIDTLEEMEDFLTPEEISFIKELLEKISEK